MTDTKKRKTKPAPPRESKAPAAYVVHTPTDKCSDSPRARTSVDIPPAVTVRL